MAKDEFPIHIDKKQYKVSSETVTGAQLRALPEPDLAGTSGGPSPVPTAQRLSRVTPASRPSVLVNFSHSAVPGMSSVPPTSSPQLSR